MPYKPQPKWIYTTAHVIATFLHTGIIFTGVTLACALARWAWYFSGMIAP